MSTAQEASNKATLSRFDDAMSTGDAEVISKTIDELVEPDVLIHMPLPIQATGAQALKQVWAMLLRGLPDLHVAVEDLIAEGDKVVSRNTVTGTHQGEYRGLPPTGKSVTYNEIFIVRFAGGRRRSPTWTTTCGSSLTSGPAAATPASRGTGSPGGTSASSTRPGTTTGSSATPPTAPACPGWPGPHHPAPQGHRPSLTRRPCPGRLLEPAARQEPAPARPQHPAPAQDAARTLRALRGPAPARRPGAAYSRGMATAAPHHPQSDHQATHRTRAGHAGCDPPDTHLLPAPGDRRRQPGTGIFTH